MEKNSVGEILKARLVELGANGLCNSDNQCGCGFDEFAPCDCMNVEECVAAKFIHPKSDDLDYWDEYPEGYFKAL